jgi:hypothetical protein
MCSTVQNTFTMATQRLAACELIGHGLADPSNLSARQEMAQWWLALQEPPVNTEGNWPVGETPCGQYWLIEFSWRGNDIYHSHGDGGGGCAALIHPDLTQTEITFE